MHFRPHSCVSDIEDKYEFSLSIGYNDVNCDVEMDNVSGQVGTEIILQHHDKILTSGDIGLHVSCVYNVNSSVVYQAMELGDELQNRGYTHQMMLKSPDIRMRITDQDGQDISTAMVGDPLAIRFEILDTDAPYDMYVRELVAMDGVDSSNIMLVDTFGCPTDTSIIQSIFSVSQTPKTLQANFDAFRFAGSSIVQFRAMVTPCIPACDPVVCDDTSTRVRRSVTNTTDPDSTVVLANRLTIVDTLEARDTGGGVDSQVCGYRTGHLMTVYTVCVVFSVLLICQCLIIVICVKLRKTQLTTNVL